MTKREHEIISNLQEAMCKLQDALEPLGLDSNSISWANDLYSAVQVLYFGENPDGDFEEELHENLLSGAEEPMSFEEAKNCLIVRINNMASRFMPSEGCITRF